MCSLPLQSMLDLWRIKCLWEKVLPSTLSMFIFPPVFHIHFSYNPGSLLAASRPTKLALYVQRFSKVQEIFVLKKFSPLIRKLSHTIGYTVPPNE
jgi:hypothetical protein